MGEPQGSKYYIKYTPNVRLLANCVRRKYVVCLGTTGFSYIPFGFQLTYISHINLKWINQNKFSLKFAILSE